MPTQVLQWTVAGGVVRRRVGDEWHYLLILDGHGNWGIPKGHLEEHEGPLEAAVREVGEETGVHDLVMVQPLRTLEWEFTLDGKKVEKTCHLFLFESSATTLVPQASEGIRCCEWVPGDEAVTRTTFGNVRALLAEVHGAAG